MFSTRTGLVEAIKLPGNLSAFIMKGTTSLLVNSLSTPRGIKGSRISPLLYAGLVFSVSSTELVF